MEHLPVGDGDSEKVGGPDAIRSTTELTAELPLQHSPSTRIHSQNKAETDRSARRSMTPSQKSWYPKLASFHPIGFVP
jgi:hypothetical protein